MKKNLLTGLAIGAVVALAGVALSPIALAGEGHKEMAKSEPMAKVGSAAPDFTLKDTDGKEVKLSAFKGKVVVLEWYNSGCPFVKRHYEKYTTMKDSSSKYGDKVVWLAINSGAPGKEGHGKDKQSKTDWKIAYPILNDESGTVGKLYGAKTTPHMFIVDQQGMLVYAGAIDNDAKDEMPKDKKVNYVTQAIDELMAGKKVSQPETKPYGCSVKYGA